MSLIKLGLKKSKDKPMSSAEVAGVATGTAFGLKGVERLHSELKNRPRDFRSFDEVLAHYKDAKPGDVLFFQETFTGGKGHPIVILDNKNHYYWPNEQGWNKGVRKPLSVNLKGRKPISDPEAHISQILRSQNPATSLDDYAVHRPLKGRFFEVLNRNPNPVEVGSLEGKLWEMSSVQRKVRTPDGFKWERQFSPQAARRLSSVWRDPNVNPYHLDQAAEKMKDMASKGKLRYSVFSSGMNLKDTCAKGHCIHGADEILRQAGANRPNRAYFPGQMREGLKEVIPSRAISTGKVNMLAPILATAGAISATEGVKEDNSKKTLVGAAAIGAGIGINSIAPIHDKMNAAGGIVARSVGGTILEFPAKIIDKIRSRNKFIPEWQTSTYATQQWMGRHPRAAGRIGALTLGLPAAYGIHKGIQALSNKDK